MKLTVGLCESRFSAARSIESKFATQPNASSASLQAVIVATSCVVSEVRMMVASSPLVNSLMNEYPIEEMEKLMVTTAKNRTAEGSSYLRCADDRPDCLATATEEAAPELEPSPAFSSTMAACLVGDMVISLGTVGSGRTGFGMTRQKKNTKKGKERREAAAGTRRWNVANMVDEICATMWSRSSERRRGKGLRGLLAKSFSKQTLAALRAGSPGNRFGPT